MVGCFRYGNAYFLWAGYLLFLISLVSPVSGSTEVGWQLYLGSIIGIPYVLLVAAIIAAPVAIMVIPILFIGILYLPVFIDFDCDRPRWIRLSAWCAGYLVWSALFVSPAFFVLIGLLNLTLPVMFLLRRFPRWFRHGHIVALLALPVVILALSPPNLFFGFYAWSGALLLFALDLLALEFLRERSESPGHHARSTF